jgi:nucleotide-binding universal stress UspA family protein
MDYPALSRMDRSHDAETHMRERLHILIPLDGSKRAQGAVTFLHPLLPVGIERVLLLGAVQEDAHPGPRHQEEIERERHLLSSYLDELAEELRVSTVVDVETKTIRGNPATSILDEADAFQPDMVLISTHGSSGTTRWRLGSVADKVIRGAACPTFVVGPGAASEEESLAERIMPAFEAILVPLDGSELAQKALPLAIRLAEASGATIHLVGVVALGDLAGSTAWAGVSPALEEDLSRQAKDYLDQVCGAQTWQGPVHAAVRFGTPADALEEYIRTNDIDLTVMTSHGRGGLLRTALGSTTDRLLGAAPSPVLIVRGEG